jgi:Ni,Fe-hydrogenase III large subunit
MNTQRQVLSRDKWLQLAGEPSPSLLALWADTREVYALLRDGDTPMLVSTEIQDGAYPALSPARPGAAWFERMIRDLWGHVATGGVDQRPWLDHARWGVTAPMALRPGPARTAEPIEFAWDEALDQLPIGPVRGGIEPAAHVRLGLMGEAIVRLEARLGYTHKGTLALLRGKSPRAAARFAARLAGEATVAHSIAFARAAEAALAGEVPERALALRELMAALERVAAQLSALGAIAGMAAGPTMAARFAWHTETIRRAAASTFGHRLMMDCVIPGGVASEIAPGAAEALGQSLISISDGLPDPGRLQENWPIAASMKDLTSTPADRLSAIKRDIEQARDLVLALPDGAISVPLLAESGEGLGFADGPGGEVWHWLRLDHGQIASAFLCDPAWRTWPLLEASVSAARLEDLPLIMASSGLSISGMDL